MFKSLLKAVLLCAVVDGAAAYLLAGRSGESDRQFLLMNAMAGVLTGAVGAFIVGLAIIWLRWYGYAVAVAMLGAMIVASVMMANNPEYLHPAILTGLIGLIIPLYILAAVITCFVVHPQPKKNQPS